MRLLVAEHPRTYVVEAVAGPVQRPRVELQADDREDDDGEEHQQPDLEQRRHGLDDRLEHDLQACHTHKHQYPARLDSAACVGSVVCRQIKRIEKE